MSQEQGPATSEGFTCLGAQGVFSRTFGRSLAHHELLVDTHQDIFCFSQIICAERFFQCRVEGCKVRTDVFRDISADTDCEDTLMDHVESGHGVVMMWWKRVEKNGKLWEKVEK